VKKVLKTTLVSLSAASIAACAQADKTEVSLLDVAHAAARQDDRVSVDDLANWLIEERGDFMLVDVRMPADFDKGNIQGADNIPIAQLVSPETLANLPTDRRVVVYSNGSENAAKATTMLRLSGIDAHLLTGGYNAWHEKILNPDIPTEAFDGESLRASAQRAYSCYFVGERSELGAKRSKQAAEPFVPPVFTEEEELLAPPPSAGEESC